MCRAHNLCPSPRLMLTWVPGFKTCATAPISELDWKYLVLTCFKLLLCLHFLCRFALDSFAEGSSINPPDHRMLRVLWSLDAPDCSKHNFMPLISYYFSVHGLKGQQKCILIPSIINYQKWTVAARQLSSIYMRPVTDYN